MTRDSQLTLLCYVSLRRKQGVSALILAFRALAPVMIERFGEFCAVPVCASGSISLLRLRRLGLGLCHLAYNSA